MTYSAGLPASKDPMSLSSANLRGHGTSITLVLLNGRRMANFALPGDDAGVDLMIQWQGGSARVGALRRHVARRADAQTRAANGLRRSLHLKPRQVLDRRRRALLAPWPHAGFGERPQDPGPEQQLHQRSRRPEFGRRHEHRFGRRPNPRNRPNRLICLKAHPLWDLSGACSAPQTMTLRTGVKSSLGTSPPFSEKADS